MPRDSGTVRGVMKVPGTGAARRIGGRLSSRSVGRRSARARPPTPGGGPADPGGAPPPAAPPAPAAPEGGPAGRVPPPAGPTVGTLPSGFGERFDTIVVLLTMGAGRNAGATLVRHPQYRSSRPRHRLRMSS